MLDGRRLFLIASMLVSGLGQAAPKAPAHCEDDDVPWNGGCFGLYEWTTDEKTCPEGIIVIPDGEKKPRCVRCEDYEDGRQQPQNYCQGTLASRADAKLDELFQSVLKRFPAHASELRAAQTAWRKGRDKACRREEKEYEGGSMAPEIYAYCALQGTNMRTEELKTMIERVGDSQAKAAKACAGGPPSPSPIDRRATVVVEKSRFYSDPKVCAPGSQCPWLRKGYLVRGDQVAETAVSGDFVCVAFKTTTGWLPLRDLCEMGAACSQSAATRPTTGGQAGPPQDPH